MSDFLIRQTRARPIAQPALPGALDRSAHPGRRRAVLQLAAALLGAGIGLLPFALGSAAATAAMPEAKPRAASQPPSKLGLAAGQSISLDDAMRATAVRSANDMAVVLAEHIAGSEAQFTARMTAKARELAQSIVKNAPATNYAIINGIGRIAEMPMGEGLFAETMVTAMTRSAGVDASRRISEFFEGRRQRPDEQAA